MAKVVRIVNGIPRIQDESSSVSIYDETIEVGSAISAGTPISLPNGKTYTGDELIVRFRGQDLTDIYDYNWVGASAPRTQIAFTFDLEVGDYIGFRIDRAP